MTQTIPLSVLDLCPVGEGMTAADAMAQTVTLARAAEDLGYARFWLAEHHNMPGIAGGATAVLIGHVAGATRRIRVGAGGIMLPNHAPLAVAEQFATLATLHPGRIDLGLGRAPGSDMATARALRRHLSQGAEFADEVVELLAILDGTEGVRALPGPSPDLPVWILGSSLYGAQLAAALGLPYAFASHFAPAMLSQALAIYRARFSPSRWLSRPHAMVAVGLCAAETDAQAAYLRTSQRLAFARLITGRPGALPAPVADIAAEVPAQVLAQVDQALSVSAVGGPATVAARLRAIVDAYRPDEIIMAGMIHDPAARARSLAIAAEVAADLRLPETAGV